MYLMLFCGSMVQPSRNGLVGGRSLNSLKQMIHKDPTVSYGLLNEVGTHQPSLSRPFRPLASGPMTMIGVALTFGASVPLLSAHEPVMAADGLNGSESTTSLVNGDEASSSGTVAYHTVESGDSLWQIAKYHDADIKVLEITNSISADEVLRVGQVLKVPTAAISSTTVSPDSSTLALGGVGGELTSLSLASSSSDLRLTEEFSDGWETLDPFPKSTLNQTSQSAIGSERLLAESNSFSSGSQTSLPVAETLVSFSSTGSLVSVTYSGQVSSSTREVWVDASTQISEATQKGFSQIALLQSELDLSNNFQESQSLSQSEVKLAASNIYAVNREQRLRESLARIRESNTVSIDRDQLASKIALARQQLERSSTQESAGLVGLVHSPNSLSSPMVSSATSQPDSPDLSNSGSRANGWTVADVADSSSTEATIAKSTSVPIDALTTSVFSDDVTNRDLLAAAPLDPDIYRPLPITPSGQTVTPGMPMLPGAGDFLPQAPAESSGYVWPTRGTFTSGYGWRWGRMHRGIDIAGPVGTPVVAAASGVVVRSGWNSGGYGNVVDIRHRDGSMTRYAHNSRLLVREGQQVNQGQSIAQMGSTGFSTGPHLHFEIHLPGNGTVNPIAYLPGR